MQNNNLGIIQLLRGFAALFVVLQHVSASTNFYLNTSEFNNVFEAGWFGVDFFFIKRFYYFLRSSPRPNRIHKY